MSGQTISSGLQSRLRCAVPEKFPLLCHFFAPFKIFLACAKKKCQSQQLRNTSSSSCPYHHLHHHRHLLHRHHLYYLFVISSSDIHCRTTSFRYSFPPAKDFPPLLLRPFNLTNFLLPHAAQPFPNLITTPFTFHTTHFALQHVFRSCR